MDNKNHNTDNNLERNLGNALIEWVRMTKGRNQKRYKESDNSYNNGQSSNIQYPDLLSVKTNNSDSQKNRKRNFYSD
jgi:hypothetical protein